MALPLIPIISGIFGFGKTLLENKRKKSEAKAEKDIELIRQIGSFEELHAKGSQTSWKDEYWTVVFSIPLIMCFIPHTVQYVDAGFEALKNTPTWYTTVLLTLVGASVGIRQLDKHFDRKRVGK